MQTERAEAFFLRNKWAISLICKGCRAIEKCPCDRCAISACADPAKPSPAGTLNLPVSHPLSSFPMQVG